jgi:hypothetical protein
MASETPAFLRSVLVASLIATAVGRPSHAWAGPETLREGLFGGRPSEGRTRVAPTVARYVSEEGQGFILDRTHPKPLLKFDNNPEVWALQAQPAPRGDIIYKNDLGEPMLRATRLGGVTVFTDGRPGGSAAALAGGGLPLKLAPMGPQALLERLAQASARASRAAKRLITFDAEATPASSALIADAAMVTAEAIVRMSRRPDGRQLLAKITKVTLVEGRKGNATVQRGVMRVSVAAADGLAGRPSSGRIAAMVASR